MWLSTFGHALGVSWELWDVKTSFAALLNANISNGLEGVIGNPDSVELALCDRKRIRS